MLLRGLIGPKDFYLFVGFSTQMNDVTLHVTVCCHRQDTKESKTVRDEQIAAVLAPLPALKWGQGNSRCYCLFRAKRKRKDF